MTHSMKKTEPKLSPKEREFLNLYGKVPNGHELMQYDVGQPKKHLDEKEEEEHDE